MKSIFLLALCLHMLVSLEAAQSSAPPKLPLTGKRIVKVRSEAELQAAMGQLQHGDTLLLADGIYDLSSSLFVKDRNDVTIRGISGSTNVVLVGKGMDNRNCGETKFGIWSNATNTTVAHLTVRDTYDNAIIFNPPAQSPHLYSVRLLNAGSQFIKSNPTDVRAGIGVNDGLVECCWLEYTGGTPSDHGSGSGYFNGISAHAARNWIVRNNVFKNLHNPDSAAYLWNPAVLFWRNSSNTVTEQNTFINVDRAVAYGLDNTTPYSDHAGGLIRSNFVYLAPGFMTPKRKSGSDAPIIAWNSPGTRIDSNIVLVNSNAAYAIEFRFPSTTNCAAIKNVGDAPVHLRDQARAEQSGNVLVLNPEAFIDSYHRILIR